MLDYLHSNSVNDDLDINTIMIVPCGVFVFTSFCLFFLSLLLGIPPREMKSLSDSSFQGGKHALQGERIAIVIPGFHESKVVDT